MVFQYFAKGEPDSHPCEKEGCKYLALYDDEPYCIEHSASALNREVEGYSYWKKNNQ